MPHDDLLRSLAAMQFGVVSRSQASALGFDRHALAHRRRRGEWVDLSPRVMRSASAPEHPMLPATAGVLDVGGDAMVCLEAAAALWGAPGFLLEPVHVLRERGLHPRPDRLAIVHTSVALPPGHSSRVDGVTVTTPLRTIFDLAGVLHPARTERLLDNAVGRGLCTYRGLHQMLDSFAGRGRAGVQLLRDLAAERPPDSRPPESGLEARANQILVRDGQRPLDRQVELGEERWTGRFDLVDRADDVVLEVHSDTYHGSVIDRRRDAERRAELEAAGWVVVEAHQHDIWHRPQIVADAVRDARRRGRELRRLRALAEPVAQPEPVGSAATTGSVLLSNR